MLRAFAVPILPGKTEAFRQLIADVCGSHREAFAELQRHSGVIEEWSWIQSTPSGDLVIVVIDLKATDLIRDRMVDALGQMPSTFSTWFRHQIRDIFGFDPGIRSGAGVNELILHWRADQS